MRRFLNKSYPFDFGLSKRLIISAWTGLGIFLLILFFQPFGIDKTNLDNYILLITGFGGISILTQLIIHLSIPVGRISSRPGHYNFNILLLFELIIWILVSVAFSFYLRYVCGVRITFFIEFRLILIALLPAVVNMIIYEISDLRERLKRAGGDGRNVVAPPLENAKAEYIEFRSSAGSDRLKVNINSLLMIRSAENYVEIYYYDQAATKRVLLRNTLRNMEELLSSFPGIARCHRNSIVNLQHAQKLKRSPGGFSLVIKDISEDIPVSRQYLLQVRELLENRL